ncbi:hypothetical protein EDB71_1229 [Vibrio crassostreae]|nr:hypothetical protein EDB71_1229 [Vibrio crassostreae]
MRFLLFLLFISIASGCSTVKDARNSLTSVEGRVYKASLDELWDSTISIIDRSDLQLIYENKLQGDLLGQRPINAFSWGENVFINVISVTPSTSCIKVSSKKSVYFNVTAKNWKEYIYDKLDENFESVTD